MDLGRFHRGQVLEEVQPQDQTGPYLVLRTLVSLGLRLLWRMLPLGTSDTPAMLRPSLIANQQINGKSMGSDTIGKGACPPLCAIYAFASADSM